MIDKRDEFGKMFRLEQRLWWYRILHESVERALLKQFGSRRDIAILDAGCGTGGLLDFLRRRGYKHLRGIDGSADAVAFCHERGLDVTLVNLNELASVTPQIQYDAIVCNDVFCYFDDPALHQLIYQLALRLKPGGLLISNNNAFNVFRGQHDIAVGSIRRFVLADFERLAPIANLQILSSTYWSLALSPLILLIRQWQNWQLRAGWRSADQPASDVYFPGEWVNQTLYKLVRAEQQWLPQAPFGSSLFVTFKK
ncbi:class I SAM-dependent DNA methyltransferase [Spirosoma soli]|uniref:Class I SAM-dependent DNA methyltransferase n=1 Tax=Spirosoma soli TaxID=1770529 RepID=A0ABW5M533_9BACT